MIVFIAIMNTLLAERKVNKDDSANSKYPTRGIKESE